MVFERGFGSGSGVGGQDRPGLTDDPIWQIIVTEVS